MRKVYSINQVWDLADCVAMFWRNAPIIWLPETPFSVKTKSGFTAIISSHICFINSSSNCRARLKAHEINGLCWRWREKDIPVAESTSETTGFQVAYIESVRRNDKERFTLFFFYFILSLFYFVLRQCTLQLAIFFSPLKTGLCLMEIEES